MSFFIKCPRLCPFLLFLIVWTAFADYDRRIFFITSPFLFSRRQILSIFLSQFFFFAVSPPNFCYFLIFCLLPLFFSIIFSLALFFAYRRNFPPCSSLVFFLFSLLVVRFSFLFISLFPAFSVPPFPLFISRILFLLLLFSFRPSCLPAPRPGSLLFLSFSLSPVSSSLSAFRPSFSHLYASFFRLSPVFLPPHFLFSQRLPALFRIFPLLSPSLKPDFVKTFYIQTLDGTFRL